MPKRLCDAYNKFRLVLLGNPKLGVHRKTEASDSSCAESRDYYCCSEVATAAVALHGAKAAPALSRPTSTFRGLQFTRHGG
ncbi:hypothetical protein llap_20307 [Limosa lapponica baueri]|uniref:Uncharacterized protein n=1 Tax=Limosa lapponica baueri TaxID=1758121 RepID=A0A2I0T6I7_LIMLA|nr:hypothetical protein llap_20307 [Limosa lapponica baueri]